MYPLQDPQSSGSFPEKEEMELSLKKLEKELKEAHRLRDKALQELNRLKKHLLDKVFVASVMLTMFTAFFLTLPVCWLLPYRLL